MLMERDAKTTNAKTTCLLFLNNMLTASNCPFTNLIQKIKVGIAEPAILKQEEGHPGERKEREGKTDAGPGF